MGIWVNRRQIRSNINIIFSMHMCRCVQGGLAGAWLAPQLTLGGFSGGPVAARPCILQLPALSSRRLLHLNLFVTLRGGCWFFFLFNLSVLQRLRLIGTDGP